MWDEEYEASSGSFRPGMSCAEFQGDDGCDGYDEMQKLLTGPGLMRPLAPGPGPSSNRCFLFSCNSCIFAALLQSPPVATR